MGTRNLTCVYYNGEYKVAQYGQWDGYPGGQGLTCLGFVRDRMDEAAFNERLKEVRFLTQEELENKLRDYPKLMTMEQHKEMSERFPELSRDTAAEILDLIMSGKATELLDDLEFAADSLMCEWAYVIDMEERRFEVYEGFNTVPLLDGERFYFLEETAQNDGDKYHPVVYIAGWSFDELPTDEEFLEAFGDRA